MSTRFGFIKNCQIGLALICVGMMMGCAGPQKAPVAEKPAKADWRYGNIVGIDVVKQYVKIPKPENVVIIDSRPKRSKYDKGHICTAVSIPDSKFDKMTADLPADKSTPLIFYCGGYT